MFPATVIRIDTGRSTLLTVEFLTHTQKDWRITFGGQKVIVRTDELPIKGWASVDTTHEERNPGKYFLTFSVRQKVLWECENPDPKELPNVDINLGPEKDEKIPQSKCSVKKVIFFWERLTLHPKSKDIKGDCFWDGRFKQ